MTNIERIVKIIENYSPELAAEEILLLFSVSSQRELLIAFSDAINLCDGDSEKIGKLVDLYLKSN